MYLQDSAAVTESQNFDTAFCYNLTFHRCNMMLSAIKQIIRCDTKLGKISAQPHTIVKQICFPYGNVVFLSLFSLSKN